VLEGLKMKRSCLLFVLLLCCLWLAACSSVSAAGATPPDAHATAGTPVPVPGPTLLHITRTDPSATGKLGPLDRTVTNAQQVQNLYRTALALPAYAVGSSISQSCLNDPGVIYHLDFLQGPTEVQQMNLDPGSCRILYLDRTDLRQASEGFLTLLKRALRLNSLTAA
jgi:hypothetical protein